MLYSPYYKSKCGKGFFACSAVGGCVLCAPLQCGPADDHQCMVAGELFEGRKWAVPEGARKAIHLYDSGVRRKTKTLALESGFELVTSGIVRTSMKHALSAYQRLTNWRHSSMRIRVENFIGSVKQHFRLLTNKLPYNDIPIMSKLVYLAYMLHNFRPNTVFAK